MNLDKIIFIIVLMGLAIAVFAWAPANIIVDPVDYYVNLQRLLERNEQPLVRNAYFSRQRSPGYSLFSAVSYGVISVVSPFVKTEKIFPHYSPKDNYGLPTYRVFLRDIFFKDFFIEMENSWYKWKLIAALALTSYAFLIAGILAAVAAVSRINRKGLRWSLPVIFIILSPVFCHNIIDTPLYPTMAAFGCSAIFAALAIKGVEDNNLKTLVFAGLWLGLTVLVRLEFLLFASVFIASLIFRTKNRNFLLALFSGLAVSLIFIGLSANLLIFGNLLHLDILKGDINKISFNLRYIFESIFALDCGFIFWTPLLLPGIAGLFLSRSPILKSFAWACVAMIFLYLVRVPIMYGHIGSGAVWIGNLPVTPPSTFEGMRSLMRFDMNRYLTILAPFAILGIKVLTQLANSLRNTIEGELR